MGLDGCKAKLGHDFNARSGKCRYCPERAPWAPKSKAERAALDSRVKAYRPYSPKKDA